MGKSWSKIRKTFGNDGQLETATLLPEQSSSAENPISPPISDFRFSPSTSTFLVHPPSSSSSSPLTATTSVASTPPSCSLPDLRPQNTAGCSGRSRILLDCSLEELIDDLEEQTRLQNDFLLKLNQQEQEVAARRDFLERQARKAWQDRYQKHQERDKERLKQLSKEQQPAE